MVWIWHRKAVWKCFQQYQLVQRILCVKGFPFDARPTADQLFKQTFHQHEQQQPTGQRCCSTGNRCLLSSSMSFLIPESRGQITLLRIQMLILLMSKYLTSYKGRCKKKEYLIWSLQTGFWFANEMGEEFAQKVKDEILWHSAHISSTEVCPLCT